MTPAPTESAVASGDLGFVSARLLLWSVLAWANENGTPTAWSPADWDRLVRTCDPREVAVVALHGVRGFTFDETAAWLGTGRGMADILWRRAAEKMRREVHTGAV